MEILGCISGVPDQATDENRMHLLGHVNELKSICQRTGLSRTIDLLQSFWL